MVRSTVTSIDLDTEDETSGQVEELKDLPKDEREEVAGLVAEALDENFQMHNDVSKIHSVEIMGYPEMSDCQNSEMDSGTSTDDSSEDEADMEVAEVTGSREEPSNLELAWQMLELAKLVYTRLSLAVSGEGKKGAEARLASTLLGLAEVSMEAGSFRQAVDDFSACLRVRKQSSPADSRYDELVVVQMKSLIYSCSPGPWPRRTTSWPWPRPPAARSGRPRPASTPPSLYWTRGGTTSARWSTLTTSAGSSPTSTL